MKFDLVVRRPPRCQRGGRRFNCGSFAVSLSTGGPSTVRAARSLDFFLDIVFHRRWTGRQQQRGGAAPLRALPHSSRGRWWWCFGRLWWCFFPLSELVRFGPLWWRQFSRLLHVVVAASLRRPSGSRGGRSSCSLPPPSPPSLCHFQYGLPSLLVQLQRRSGQRSFGGRLGLRSLSGSVVVSVGPGADTPQDDLAQSRLGLVEV